MWPIDERAGGAEYDTISARIAGADLFVARDLKNAILSFILQMRRARRFECEPVARSAALIHHPSDDSAAQILAISPRCALRRLFGRAHGDGADMAA